MATHPRLIRFLNIWLAVVFVMITAVGMRAASEDPFAIIIRVAERNFRAHKYDAVLTALLPLLERQPDHADVLRILGETLMEKGDTDQGMRAILAAWRLQGKKPIWSPTDKTVYRNIEKAVLKYDIAFRDVRKEDARFIKNCARLLKQFDKDETRDIFNEILHVCMEIQPGDSRVRPYFAKKYTGDDMFANRFQANDGSEAFDPEQAMGSDMQFSLDFSDQTNFRRLWNMFKMHPNSNPAASPASEDGYFYFDVEYGDPNAYMEHRRVPLQPGRQLKIEFEAKGAGRLIMGSPKPNTAVIIDTGAMKAFPFEHPDAAKPFQLAADGYGVAILQYTDDGFLKAYINGYEIFNNQLNPGETADLSYNNLFFGIESKPRVIRIFVLEYGPLKQVQTVENQAVYDPNQAPTVTKEDMAKAEAVYAEALVKLKTRNWKKAIPILSDAIGYNPLFWEACKQLGDAQEKANRRREAVTTWKMITHRTEIWGTGDPDAKTLHAFAVSRLDAIDKEGRKWQKIIDDYVNALLVLRNKKTDNPLRIKRIDWRIKLVDPAQKLEPVTIDTPAKPKPKVDTPRIPGLDIGQDDNGITIK